MSLNGKKRKKSFWGSAFVVIIIAACAATTAGMQVWNAVAPYWDVTKTEVDIHRFLHLRFGIPLGTGLAAVVLPLVNQHQTAKRAVTNGTVVAEAAYDMLVDLKSAMGRLSADDNYQDYFNDLVSKCGPRLFRGRKVRIGFFILEGGETEDGQLVYLRKRSAHEHGNRYPLSFVAGTTDLDGRDQAADMIAHALETKDLCVPDIRKDSSGWAKHKLVKKSAYSCFISAPVTDTTGNVPLGLLTVDSKNVGDLTEADQDWVGVLAGMLSHGLRDEVAVVPKPAKP